MADVRISEKLWKEVTELARRKRRKPEAIAAEALQDYLRRIGDEELWRQTERAARSSRFRIEDTEELIRRYRRKKA